MGKRPLDHFISAALAEPREVALTIEDAVTAVYANGTQDNEPYFAFVSALIEISLLPLINIIPATCYKHQLGLSLAQNYERVGLLFLVPEL